MSLKTWKEEFYPTPADKFRSPDSGISLGRLTKADKLEAAQHSLQKWRGLRQPALARHKVRLMDLDAVAGTSYAAAIEDIRTHAIFSIMDDTCSLCVLHRGMCWRCPLNKQTSGCGTNHNEPYGIFCWDNDPEPMIAALEATVAELEKD